MDWNRDARSIYCECLEHIGYETIEALDGPEAFDKAVYEVPHLILLELTLPTMSGVEVLEALKSEPATRRIPVLLITAATGERFDQAALLRFDAVLRKPITPKDVAAVIADHIGPP